MTAMHDVLGITGPIYLTIALGYMAVRFGLFAKSDMRVFGQFVLYVGLPALLFNALSQRRVSEIVNWDYLLAYALGSMLILLGALAWSKWVARRSASAGAYFAMGMSCANSGFIGYPTVLLALGGPVAGVVLALNMLVENLLKLPLLFAVADSGQGPQGTWRHTLAQALKGLLRNPLVIAIAAGVGSSVANVQLPGPVSRTLGLLAQTSGALALFVIGGTLVGLQVRGLRTQVAQIAVGKLVLHPLAVLAAFWVVPVSDPQLRMAAILSAGMPMLGIYPLLALKHGHEGVSAAALLVTTVAAFATISLLLAALRLV